jgi:hypothetical protein
MAPLPSSLISHRSAVPSRAEAKTIGWSVVSSGVAATSPVQESPSESPEPEEQAQTRANATIPAPTRSPQRAQWQGSRESALVIATSRGARPRSTNRS